MMFRILSLKEEKAQNQIELQQYYAELCNYVLNRKLTNTTPCALTLAPKLKKITNIIAGKLTKILCRSNVTVISDGQENIPEDKVIFALTHQGILDNFVWIPNNPKHSIILHSVTVKKFLKLVQLNTGLVFVSKKDGDQLDRQNAKLDMIKILLLGHSITYFPEGTWNLSPNKLHLPLSYGFLDIARKSQAAVIPVVIEYSYDNMDDVERISRVHIRYGKAIYVKIEDDLKQKLDEYEESVSTMRWELIEEKGVFHRNTISNWDYINFLKGNMRNLQMGGINIDFERMHIRGADNDFYAFHHINDIPFDDEGNLLETDEVERLKRINKSKFISI